jgi:hypothetical protein
MKFMLPTWAVLLCLPLVSGFAAAPPREPLFRVVDLDVGEAREVALPNGQKVALRILALHEHRDPLREAVRRAEVTLTVDGRQTRLVCATYRLPQTVGRVQVDCPVTRGYTTRSSKQNVWALEKDVRLRLWPAGSPWVRPGTWICPVNQRWFASDTQMANDPCYVNACDLPGETNVYYHYGLDFGGAEGLVSVLAATDGVVVSRAGKLLPGEKYPPQVQPRGDVVYLRDARGWYYRYSHLQRIVPGLRLGDRVQRGARLGVLGKEGGSGGWSHLHFDVTMPQPSGRYGITDGYAFVFQACLEQYHPALLAVARPHHVAWVNQPVRLDARRSWQINGPEHLRDFTWLFCDGGTARGPEPTRRYATPGHYSEVVKVTDDAGHVSYDVAVVQVFDPDHPLPPPPAIHVAFWPTLDLRPGQLITFKARTFGVRPDEGEEAWDFGDGSPPARTRSDGNTVMHAPDGYAVITHRYEKPGFYVVTVRRVNDRGEPAIGRVWLEVGHP